MRADLQIEHLLDFIGTRSHIPQFNRGSLSSALQAQSDLTGFVEETNLNGVIVAKMVIANG